MDGNLAGTLSGVWRAAPVTVNPVAANAIVGTYQRRSRNRFARLGESETRGHTTIGDKFRTG